MMWSTVASNPSTGLLHDVHCQLSLLSTCRRSFFQVVVVRSGLLVMRSSGVVVVRVRVLLGRLLLVRVRVLTGFCRLCG